MSRADYNPDTLNKIRTQRVNARDLGWDESFYRTVCRRHGIEPVASSTLPVVVAPPASSASPPKSAVQLARERARPPQREPETIAVPSKLFDAIKACCTARGISTAQFIRESIKNASTNLDALGPSPRGQGRPCNGTVSTSLTKDEIALCETIAKSRGCTAQEFMRIALQWAVNSQEVE